LDAPPVPEGEPPLVVSTAGVSVLQLATANNPTIVPKNRNLIIVARKR
jgi:hypothetical protein